MPENVFDERVAPTYDAEEADRFATDVVERTVDVLAELAGDGAALELGVGTGRIALPLSQRGVPVHGIDLSTAMVDQLRAKPGAESVEVTIGDFASTRVGGSFALAYLVFNTIGNLTTLDEQVACFANAAAHLEVGGTFVVEVGVPELRRLLPGTTFLVHGTGPGSIDFDEYTDLTEAQTACSHHHRIVDGELQIFSVPYRYVWPAELDLMARLAGLRLRHRWADWNRSPFSGDSPAHVSVWEKPAAR